MTIHRVLLAGAVVVYAIMLVFPFATSTLLAPAGGVAFLLAGWAAGLGVLIALLRHRSSWALAVPPAALGFWFATVAAGEAFFGWTA